MVRLHLSCECPPSSPSHQLLFVDEWAQALFKAHSLYALPFHSWSMWPNALLHCAMLTLCPLANMCAALRMMCSLVDQQLHDTNASGDVHGVVLQLLHGLSHAFVSLSPSECWSSQHDQGRTQSEWGVSIIALFRSTTARTVLHELVISGFSYSQ